MNIGELTTEDQRRILREIWRGDCAVTELPLELRKALADLYSDIARKGPAKSAQAEFNFARARYLVGEGPNPGPSVNEFMKRTGHPKFKRP